MSEYAEGKLWKSVYLCLRCGDAVTATRVLGSVASVEDNVLATVGQLARHQGRNVTFYDDGVPPQLPLTELYHRAKNRGEDIFKVASLGVLSSLPLPGDVATTIEDYIFSRLQTVLIASDCGDAMRQFGRDIRHWGVAHFKSAWGYALPLLYAQEFETAVTFLGENGFLMEATHLAMPMSLVAVKDLPVETLLVTYANSFQMSDPEAALEYLVRVKNKRVIIDLILDTKAFSLLAGNVADDGRRDESGALRAHFETRELDRILVDCAERANREGNLKECAELLILAGEYGALIRLFVRELAGLLCVTKETEERRRFWKEAATTFHEMHIAPGRTYVIGVLQDQDNTTLGNTYQLIMNLTVFFDRIYDRKWDEASGIISHLHILPQNETEIPYLVEAFHSLDNSIKRSFHEIVIATLEMLQQQHALLKSSGRSAGTSVEQKLGELRREASLIVTFSGLINVEAGGDRIARIEASMI